MICQNCQAEVDNDLIFCTECGSRLHQTFSAQQNITQPEAKTSQNSFNQEKPKISTWKWALLVLAIVTVIAVPASLLIVYFVYNGAKDNKTSNKNNQTISKKTKTPAKSVNVQTNSEVIPSSNVKETNENNVQNSKVLVKPVETTIVEEEFNVEPDGSIAFPFKVDGQMMKLTGETEIVDGDQFEGFVFLQEIYDQNGVKPEKKVFSFDTDQAEQYLTEGNYVLVFTNNDSKGVSLKVKFTMTSQDTEDSNKN